MQYKKFKVKVLGSLCSNFAVGNLLLSAEKNATLPVPSHTHTAF